MLHYENLQLYLRLAWKLKNLVLEYNQSYCLNPYVKFNTEKTTEAEKNGGKYKKVLFKILSNAVYGKAMENLRSRIDVKLVKNKEDYLPWTSKPSYKSQKYLTMI